MGIIETIVKAIIDGDSVDELKNSLSEKWVSLTLGDVDAYEHIISELSGIKIKNLGGEEDEDTSYDTSYEESYSSYQESY